MRDQLSEVLDVIEVEGVLSGGLALHGAWVSRTAPLDDPLKLFALARGHVRLTTDGIDAPVDMQPGDVVVLNHRVWLQLQGGPDTATPQQVAAPLALPPADVLESADTSDVLFGGRIAVSEAGRAYLSRALPPVTHLHAGDTATTALRKQLELLLGEARTDRPGSAFAIRQHAQLLLLEILRATTAVLDLPAGFLRLITDQRLNPAVASMHDHPDHDWTLPELARIATMSRTTFAERFRDQAGVPPLTYLTGWRMLLARRALHSTDTSISTLATQVGYSSDSAFTTAFTRHTGETPLRYRKRTRSTQTPR